MMLGPGVNIVRTPLCGRDMEYLSEDPHLAGELAAADIQGIQSCDVVACVKHFALNNQELNRGGVDAEVDDRTLHEIYLPAFEAAYLSKHLNMPVSPLSTCFLAIKKLPCARIAPLKFPTTTQDRIEGEGYCC
jgi:beta-glucosidase-like glycosyl hydrolase